MRTVSLAVLFFAVVAGTLVYKPLPGFTKSAPVAERADSTSAVDSLKDVQLVRAIASVRAAVSAYREGIGVDSTIPAVPELSMYKACLLWQLQKGLLLASGQVEEALPAYKDSLLLFRQDIAGRMAENLRLVFELPIEARRVEMCFPLVFDDGIELTKEILINRRLAGTPLDSVKLRDPLLKDLRKVVKEIRRETPDYISRDWTVLRAVCDWNFFPEDLGLRLNEIPTTCDRKPALRFLTVPRVRT